MRDVLFERARVWIAFVLIVLGLPAFAASYTDPLYGFSITPPQGWSTENLQEGEDRVFRFQSPDGTAYGEVRAMPLDPAISVETLIQVYQDAALSDARLEGSQPDVVGGMQGTVSAWSMGQGEDMVIVGGFFAVQDGMGYILMTITSATTFETYSPIYDAAFDTFVPGQAPGNVEAPTKPLANPLLKGGMSKGLQVGPPSVGPGAGMVTEAHPELGFVISRKADWVVDQPEVYSVRMGPKMEPMHAAPTLTIEALSGDAYGSLQDFAADLKSQLANEPGATFDQEGPHRVETVAVDGVPLEGWSFGVVFERNGEPIRIIFYLFKREVPSVYYGVYVTGPTEQVMAHQSDLMQAMSTLQIVPFGN